MKINMRKIIVLIFLIVFMAVDFRNVSFVARAKDDVSDIQNNMDKVQNKIKDVQKKLNQSQSQLSQTQSQIYTTSNLIAKTKEEINRKETELENLENKIKLNKKILTAYFQKMYFDDQDASWALDFGQQDFSQYFQNFDQVLNAKEKLLTIMTEIKADKEKTEVVKEELAEKKEDHEKLLSVKQMEQREIKADIQDAKTTLNQLSSKLNNLRSKYSKLLGKSVSTGDILKAAKFAAKATRMNKSFLLGVLIQESNKGQSTGSCNYKESKMTDTQSKAFKKICSELDYNYKKMHVSCPPKNYKGTGGAMGVPQFMPTTWQYGGGTPTYKKRIANLTGHKIPDPWNLVDGVTAMAIKLSQDGASEKSRDGEARAYCVYLAGGNWKQYCPKMGHYKDNYDDYNCWGSYFYGRYGAKVLCLRDNYKKYY